ncbi:FhuF-like iron-sulfur protein [Nocardia neocaledoniensis]|uniref:FhuF-like iron-sulfur protein n=1 Tax=Nocardia neocaledoniensis TaxID=236511 RepID=A0A317P129_9NOCA|nr:FhuF-like iron-sulfur protein [Nocardia neocaledoniensis]
MVAQSPDVVSTVPGRLLIDPAWISARIGEMSRAWGTDAARVGGTLWWCMVASALVDQITRAHAVGAPAPVAALDELDCEVRPDGGVEHVCFRSTGDTETVAAALRETLNAVIPQVAAVSGAGVPALWAVVADAIGNRALDAGAGEAGSRLAAEVGGRLPAPRFVTVGERTFVKRISCCLVYEVPGCQMCTSCPKRPAAERAALLAEA